MESTKSIGICPICGQGHITEHPFGWACDNSKKNDDGTLYNCKFVVFRQYHGANITEVDVKTLLATGETGELQMCKYSWHFLPVTSKDVAPSVEVVSK